LVTERVEQIVELLKNTGRVQKNQLIRLIEKKGLMSHQTANNAIDEAVRTHRIIREEKFKGKQKIVFFTVHADISENENYHLEELEKLLKEFDARFIFFKEKYESLSIMEKAKGFDRFWLLLLHFHVTVEALWRNFGKTKMWTDLMNEIRSRTTLMNKLMSSGSNLERGRIARYVIERKFLYLNEAIELLDTHLKELKK
jgi:hypothetical protein